MIEIELSTGNIINGNFEYLGHFHPDDEEDAKPRNNWHYYRNLDSGEIHHLRAIHIVRVTEIMEGVYERR